MATFPQGITPLAGVLNRRGISQEQATVLELGAVTPQAAFANLGYIAPGEITFMEALPYFDADGHPLGNPQFFRYRINYLAGWVPPDGKWDMYPKYRSPKRKGEFVYLPRGVIDWTAVYGNPEEPIIITEGEYKAIKVCSAWKKPCIGLGGVWMFNARHETWPEGFDPKLLGRTVYIVHDADKESTHKTPLKGGAAGVAGAAQRLAVKLYNQGAKPVILYIARTPTWIRLKAANPDLKMGLDEYIDAGGSWEELSVQAEDPIDSAGIGYLLDTYVMYRGDKPGVLNRKTGNLYSVKDFKDVENNCKGYNEVTKGGIQVRTPVYYAPRWLDHDDRPEFWYWVFEPSALPGLDQAQGTYNRWKGMASDGAFVGPGEAERYKEVVGVWKKFTAGLCGEECREYFEKWAADIVQFPGRKTTIAILLRSTLNGVGKSLLGEILRGLVGSAHSAKMGLKDVTHHFNSLLGDRVLIQVDEANDVRKEHDGFLKDLVSAEEATVTLKGRDTVIVKNYARLFLTSNAISPIRLDEHNRRFYVLNPKLTSADQEGEWSKWVGGVVAPLLKSPEGLRMLRFYLDQVDLSEWIPTAHVPKTEAMLKIVETSASRSGEVVVQLWREFMEDEDGVWVTSPRLHASLDGRNVWAAFRDRVETDHGISCTHLIKVPGEQTPQRFRVYARKGAKGLVTKHVGDQGYMLDTKADGYAWDNKRLLDKSKAAERAWAMWGDGVASGGSGKY